MSLVLDAAAQDLLFREARTANTFTDEPVTDEQVQAIYDLVKFGPTAFNQSPLRVVLVRSAEGRERLVQHMAEGNRPKTATAPLVAILAADNEFHEELPALLPTSRRPRTSSSRSARSASPPPASTPRCRPPTSSSASAPPVWPPAR